MHFSDSTLEYVLVFSTFALRPGTGFEQRNQMLRSFNREVSSVVVGAAPCVLLRCGNEPARRSRTGEVIGIVSEAFH